MNAAVWNNILFYLVILWALFWKGLALWRAAQLKQKNWFAVILVLNSLTIGLVELVYLFAFAKNKLTFKEIKSWKNIFLKKP